MSYDEIQAIVNLMNKGTATPDQEAAVSEYADIAYKYDSDDDEYRYVIVATYSYSF